MDAPTNWVMLLAALPDGRSAVSACNDHHLRVWDAESGRELRKWKACGWFPNGMAVSADGSRVLVAATDWMRVWTLADGTPVSETVLKPDPLTAAFGPDGRVVAGLADGSLVWLDPPGKEVARTPGYDGAVRHVVWRGDCVYSAGADGVFRRRDATTRTAIDVPGLDATLAAWAAGGRSAVVVGRAEADKPALIDAESRKVVRRFAAGVRNPTAVAVSRSGRWATAADDGKRVTAWDASTGAVAFALAPPDPAYQQGIVRHLAFRPDPDHLIVCGWRTDAEAFAVPAGTPTAGWTPPAGRAFGGASSPDEQTRAAWTGASRVCALGRGDQTVRELATPGRVTAAAFTTEGRLLAVATTDGRVALVRVGP